MTRFWYRSKCVFVIEHNLNQSTFFKNFVSSGYRFIVCNNKAITIATTIHQIQIQSLQNKNKKHESESNTGQYGRHAYNKQTRAKTENDSKNVLCVTGWDRGGCDLDGEANWNYSILKSTASQVIARACRARLSVSSQQVVKLIYPIKTSRPLSI